MVEISFHGAAGGVTGSNFLVQTQSRQYVIDCGLFQGADILSGNNQEPFIYDPAAVDAVIITHAHLDHVGRLPQLVRAGYRGPILATEATIELTVLTLKDTLHLMLERHEQKGQPLLFEQSDLRRTIDQFVAIPYHQAHLLFGNDSVTLYDAGHILGSATVQLQVEDRKLVFSGDIGTWAGILLPKPETSFAADAVIMEATYGGKERETGPDRLTVLQEALDWIRHHNGVLLIPTFAIERTQELLYLFNQLYRCQPTPPLPVFVDSPLAIEALEVFERHQELFKQAVQRVRQVDEEIFSFRRLMLTPTVEDSKSISEVAPPKVIIAGSGMMEGGRIHHHLRRYLPDPSTQLLVIGYQAEGTLGSRIISGAKEVKIGGERVPIRAEVKVVNSFSSHADNSELLKWLQAIKFTVPDKPEIFIVHSGTEQAVSFRRHVQQLFPRGAVHLTQLHQSFRLA